MMMPIYKTDLTDPETRKAYDEYKKKHGIPAWCPLSDNQRKEFDTQYNQQKRKPLADGWQANQQGVPRKLK